LDDRYLDLLLVRLYPTELEEKPVVLSAGAR
jgi:hypothetical protein